MRQRKLGERQIGCLRALISHSGWSENCRFSWVWSNCGETVRILDSLVKRGLAKRSKAGVYRITEAGRKAILPEIRLKVRRSE